MTLTIARSELILGGQKSGKSRRAELLARDWLAQSSTHRAVLVATAQPWDDEMRLRIARHQTDRAQRVPGLQTHEEPFELAQTIRARSTPHTLLVVDCLTLWLTNLLMPFEPHQPNIPLDPPQTSQTSQNQAEMAILMLNKPQAGVLHAYLATFLEAILQSAGPIVLVGNEIGLGVIPMGRETRSFVDALGRLNQDVAAACQRVTFMAAGLPLTLKGQA